MEQVRIAKLDNLCEAIAETRADMNELRTTEAGNEQAALRVMQQHDVSAYRHSGVELLRVPGDEKLRVRTSKDNANSDAATGGGEATGAREDAIAGDRTGSDETAEG